MNVPRKIEDFLPVDIAVEQALIGLVLMRNDAWLEASEIVEAQHFSEGLHSRIWEFVSAKLDAGEKVTPLTMGAALGPDAQAEVGSGVTVSQYLARLVSEGIAGLTQAADCARTIRDLWRRRQIIALASEMQQRAVGGFDDSGVDGILDELDQELSAIRFGKEISGVVTIGSAAERALGETVRAYQSEQRVGFETGLPTLDELIGPMMPGDLVTILAGSGHGKSALGAQILRHNAEGLLPAPGYFVSMEMAALQVVRRELAADTRISVRKQKTGEVSQGEYEYLRDTAAAIQNLPIYIDDAGRMKTSQIVKRLRAMRKKYGVAIAIIDHHKLVKPEREKWNKFETIEHLAVTLKDTAKEIGICIILLAQVTRESLKESWRIKSTSLWGGEDIKQCSDIMFGAMIPSEWLKENEPDKNMTKDHDKWLQDCEYWKGRAQLVSLKVRDGPTGGFRTVGFDGDKVRFVEER